MMYDGGVEECWSRAPSHDRTAEEPASRFEDMVGGELIRFPMILSVYQCDTSRHLQMLPTLYCQQHRRLKYRVDKTSENIGSK